jgi:D-alanine transaminase
MSRIAYVNGRYILLRDAAVNVEDRGYQLADGVYEVCEVLGGRLVDERRHMDRLHRSLKELRIAWPLEPAALGVVMREVVRRNRVREGIVYVQVTRGVAPRDHAFPRPDVVPAIVVTARSLPLGPRDQRAEKGIAIATVPDNRWGRVDIKTIGLLPNALARQAAKEAGAFEAWFVDKDGFVTEGASTNAWIVTRAGVIVTRAADTGILRGITRAGVMELAGNQQLKVEERPFTVAEAKAAKEAFITSASALVTPVISVDGQKIGTGKPGPIAAGLRQAFHRHAQIGPLWASGPALQTGKK